jgi:hemolysin activation/secretion protein
MSAFMSFSWDVRAQSGAATKTNAATFEVRGYLVEGNTVLPPERFGVLSNYVGKVDIGRVREGLGALQLLYRELGFATISVTLPRQKLTNGIVRVRVVEGKLARIKVEGNHYYSSENVRRALPSLETNILLNTKWLQPELDLANQSQDRQIYPVLSPGQEPGTSDLTLKVKDRLPLHGHLEINDKSTPGTPLLRADSAIQYDNLWQRDHQVGFDYNFSPQSMKPGEQMPQFYDQPTVASYSGYYRMPLGDNHGLREKYENLPVDFGYNEVTHRFDLPAPTGRPTLIVYASQSTTDTGTRFGPNTTVTTTPTLNVSYQNSQHDPTVTGNVGTRAVVPIPSWGGLQSSFSAGIDVKYYKIQSFSSRITTVVRATTIQGSGAPPTFFTTTATNIFNSEHTLDYLPLVMGWSGSRPDEAGSFAFNYSQSLFLTPLASSRKNFQTVAGSTQAGGNYTVINAGLVRTENLPGNWSATLNANGQWASEPLINNEQFGLGGTSGVRGYQEGESYGDNGWRVLFDLHAPSVNVGYFPTENGDIPAEVRCSWFMDYGEVLHVGLPSNSTIDQWGTGVGFFLTAGEHFNARLTVAWALLDAPLSSAGTAQAYFSLGYQF